jgi:hypothetical protein
MLDRDLPAFLFSCEGCGAALADPESAISVPVDKGSGFTSMKTFCSETCASGGQVEAALLHMDSEEDADELDDE